MGGDYAGVLQSCQLTLHVSITKLSPRTYCVWLLVWLLEQGYS